MKQEGDWVDVAHFTYQHEYIFLQGRLDAEGIPYHISNENTIAADPLMSYALGGINISVLRKDVPRVQEILAEVEGNSEDAFDELPEDFWKEAPEDKIKRDDQCPNCDSIDVKAKPSTTAFNILTLLLLGLPLLVYRPNRMCKNCGHEWKPD